ncbi:MAG: acyl carrier protein [Myxococcales bacterium]
MTDKVRRAVIDWLDDKYHFGDAETLIKSDDLSLLENGVLDSLGFVNLTLFLEENYKLKIDRKSLTRENFDSLRKITTYVVNHPQFKGA